MELEELLLQLGKYGKWQIIVYSMVSLAANWPVTWHIFSITFVGKSYQFYHHFSYLKLILIHFIVLRLVRL